MHKKQIKKWQTAIYLLLRKLAKGAYCRRMLGMEVGALNGKNTHKDISYIKKVPRITKSVEAWLIKYCRTDLISIKLKEI